MTTAPPDLFSSAATSPHVTGFPPSWDMAKNEPDHLTMQLLEQFGPDNMTMLQPARAPDAFVEPDLDLYMAHGDAGDLSGARTDPTLYTEFMCGDALGGINATARGAAPGTRRLDDVDDCQTGIPLFLGRPKSKNN